jgi:uncharacterized membrane protein
LKGKLPGRGLPAEPQIEVTGKVTETYSGPIPPPPQLAAFNEIIPNGADRIMTMAENVQAAQIERRIKVLNIREKAIANEHSEIILGQWFAFFLCISALAGGIFLMWQGHTATGGLLSGAALVNIAVTLITRGKTNTRK